MPELSAAAARSSGLRRAVSRALLATALAIPLVAWGVDRAFGRDVLLIAPHDPQAVDLNRALWQPGEPVAEIYGSPLSAPIRVLVGHEGELLRPPEEPGLALLPTGEGRAHPLQVRTLWLLARLAALAFAAMAVATLALDALIRRRHRSCLAA